MPPKSNRIRLGIEDDPPLPAWTIRIVQIEEAKEKITIDVAVSWPF